MHGGHTSLVKQRRLIGDQQLHLIEMIDAQLQQSIEYLTNAADIADRHRNRMLHLIPDNAWRYRLAGMPLLVLRRDGQVPGLDIVRGNTELRQALQDPPHGLGVILHRRLCHQGVRRYPNA
jgi:hypothetical protein